MARDDATQTGNRVGRRGFFGVALGAASAGALAVGGGARPVEARQVGEERTRARYRETEHIQAYYRTNRYPRTEG